MASVLVTGAGGFIGSALCPALARCGHRVIAGLRGDRTRRGPPLAAEPRLLGDIVPGRQWTGELRGVELVVHLAQQAHRQPGAGALAGEPEAAAALARGAARAGVRRLVYLSSIKAMGEATTPGRPFRADQAPDPADAYGRTKLATEAALAAAAGGTSLELVILRPPLVYGAGVRGNFAALARLAASGLPLPFAAIDNRRSLLSLDNLIDLVSVTLVHPAAAGQVLLVRDGDDLSTAALIRLLARGQGRTSRLFAVPEAAFEALRRLPGLGAAVGRLTLSLQVDDDPTRALLGWSPPARAEAALLETARALAAAH